MRLETIEHARFRALAQIYVDKEKGIEAFEEYVKIAFPYMTAVKDRSKEAAHNALKSWVGSGQIMVRAMPESKGKSKMRAKLTKTTTQTREQAESLYKKMGNVVPT
jgi:2-oxo-4-hydroxy-4-carboxy--5-ureidoimidazoline (OHCU) decarboxylase